MVKAVFDFPTPPFLRLMEVLRLATFEAAARERLPGLVFTFVYAAPEDDGFVSRTIDLMEREGGRLAFVRLHCDRVVHERRVVAEERGRLGKLNRVESLRAALARSNLEATIPFRESVEIDTATLSAEAAARRIAAALSLPVC